MISDKRIESVADDESVGKVFMVIARDLRKCLVCEQAFTRQDSFEHSKFPCHPPASTAN